MQFTYTRIRYIQRDSSAGGFDYPNEMPIVSAGRRGLGAMRERVRILIHRVKI